MGIVSWRVGKLALFAGCAALLGWAIWMGWIGGGHKKTDLHERAFELPRRGGGRVSWKPGRPAVVHFWAEWCAPCLEEFPSFFQFVAQVSGDQVRSMQWIAVSLDASWEANQDFLIGIERKFDRTVASVLELGLDVEHLVAAQFGSFQYPETYLLNSTGEITRKWVGPQPWSDRVFQTEVVDLMKNL